jgi:hypothetical protein
MKKLVFTSLVTVVAPLIIYAHPGHGNTDGYTIIHYFVEPVHAVITWSVLAAAFLYIRATRKKNEHSKN